MGYTHHVVIDDICQMIGRESVTFQQDGIWAHITVPAGNITHEDIVERSLPIKGYLQSDNRLYALLLIGRALFLGQASTMSVIALLLAFRCLLLIANLFKPFT